MKSNLVRFQNEFRRWYGAFSLRDLSMNRHLTGEIQELERQIGELIREFSE